jgi:signal peptidase I
MGHDYHGILNDEAFYQFQIAPQNGQNYKSLVQRLIKSGKTQPEADSIGNDVFYREFINTQWKWKQLAREKLARGEFPGEANGMTHGGLIYRPVDKRENYIKRCVGLPGDRLKIDQSNVGYSSALAASGLGTIDAKVDARVDIFSLGLTYQFVTGAPKQK